MTSSSRKTTVVGLNWYNHKGTQKLLDTLVMQAIQHKGQDMYYLPRRADTFDDLWHEDDTEYFDTALGIPVYVKTAEGFLAQEAFMTQFGIDIKPQVVFTIARKQFEDNILSEEPDLIRPREGDLIFFPMNSRVFEIRFVDDKPFFYQGGALQAYDVTCELYTYAGARFTTGITEIDEIDTKFDLNIHEFVLQDRAGNYIVDRSNNYITARGWGANQDTYDPLQINDEIETYSNNTSDANTGSLIDWSANNPFS